MTTINHLSHVAKQLTKQHVPTQRVRRRGGLHAEFKTRRKAMQCAQAVMGMQQWRFEYHHMAIYIYMHHHKQDGDGEFTLHAMRMLQALYWDERVPARQTVLSCWMNWRIVMSNSGTGHFASMTM